MFCCKCVLDFCFKFNYIYLVHPAFCRLSYLHLYLKSLFCCLRSFSVNTQHVFRILSYSNFLRPLRLSIFVLQWNCCVFITIGSRKNHFFTILRQLLKLKRKLSTKLHVPVPVTVIWIVVVKATKKNEGMLYTVVFFLLTVFVLFYFRIMDDLVHEVALTPDS